MHSLRSLPARMIMRFRPLVLALLALAALPAIADADSWTRTGSLVTGRLWQTVTLLPSGQVLAAGGSSFSPFDSISSSELWNPASGAWSTAASFPTARHQQAASLLQDGRVLMTGGRISGAARGILNSWLAYDPATGTWSTPAAMPNPHSNHVQVTLQDGRVLVAGGFRTDGSQLASNEVEIFDPASGTWRAGESLPNPVANATATLLRDGSVLVAGGTSSEVARSDAVRYFPATDEWRRAGSFTDARSTHVAALLPDGNVLIAGGDARANYLSSAAVYDPATNGWTDVAPMAVARDERDRGAAGERQGARRSAARRAAAISRRAELFDPAANTWSPAASMACDARALRLDAARGRARARRRRRGDRVRCENHHCAQQRRDLHAGRVAVQQRWRWWRRRRNRRLWPEHGRRRSPDSRFRRRASAPPAPARASRPPRADAERRSARRSPTATRQRRPPRSPSCAPPPAARAADAAPDPPEPTAEERAAPAGPPSAASPTPTAPVANSLRFSGRVNGHKLSPGRYRLAVIASVGGHSPPGASDDIGFRIVR